MKVKIYVPITAILLASFIVKGQSYPFDLPNNFTAIINVNTSEKEEFNNLLLGTNTHDLRNSEGQDLVKDMNPVAIRFPHGLFANWYNWERDTHCLYGTETFQFTRPGGSTATAEIAYLSSIIPQCPLSNRVGINPLTTLNNERKARTGTGYDVVWTFNMSADGGDFTNGSPVSVARYNDLIARGFDVKTIEMGNENFYASQRSSIIPEPWDYVARAKSMYAALKALDPEIKLSVNMDRKSIPANNWWNTELTKNGTDYFDAVTVHTYIGYDPDDNTNSNEAYGVALTAREVLRKTIDDYCAVVAPDKPVWLSEWGVKSGGPNAVSALGMADCYIFMSENQDRYERANWFSVNGKLNSFLVWENNNIKYPLEKTVYGATYGIVRSVFENSKLLESEITVPNLAEGVKAVSARVVEKDGQTTIFVLNLSNQEVPFIVNIDGRRYFEDFEHKAFAFSTMSEEPSMLFHNDPLVLVKEGKGSIYLPKFSINTIVLKENKVLSLDFESLSNNDEIDKGSNLTIKAIMDDEIKEVSLFVNDTLLSSKTSAPWSWSAYPQLTNMVAASYELKLVGKTQTDEVIERKITVRTPEQWAFSEGFKPHAIPGIIQAEDYDYGGENIAWSDNSGQNTGYIYRGDDKVDLDSGGEWLKYIQGGEWLEYSVEVKRPGNYDLAIKHQTRRSPEFEAMSFSFPKSSQALFSQLICTITGSDSTAIDTFSTAFLEKGRHILRLDILGYGYDLDYFEFILTSKPIDYTNVGSVNHPSNPESYDKGDIIQHLLPPQDSLGFNFAGWFTNPECTDTIPVPAVAADDYGVKMFKAKWSPKTLSGSVFIYGNIIEGKTLYADTTNIKDNSGQLLYQWQQSAGSGFEDIPGATNSTYELLNSDAGKKLRVVIASSLQLGTIISNVTNTILTASDPAFTITYEANGGENGKITSEIVGEGGHPTLIAQPKREGYLVTTWTNAEGDTLGAQSVISSDTTLYAQWEVKTRFKVSFNMGNEIVDILTDGYPAFVPNLPEEPLQADSVFNTWITAGGERFDTTYLVIHDIEIFPTWQVKRFQLHVVSPNGGIVYEPQQATYEIHSEVTLTAIPGRSYEFTNWTGDFESTDTTIRVVMDSAINLVANYKSLPYYRLDVYFSKGEVVKYPNSSRYVAGFTVQLTATPASGYKFESWSGDFVGTANPLYLTMKEDMEIYASFVPQTTELIYLKKSMVRVIPNPNKGRFIIKLNNKVSSSYKLYNIIGREIQSGTVNSEHEIDIKDKQPGVYILQINTLNESLLLNVIVEME